MPYYATVTHNGDASAGPFDYPNVPFIDSATDIEVLVGGVLQTITTHYTVESGGSAVTGKQVLFTSGNYPAAGTGNVKVRRKTKRNTLEVDFVQGSTLTEADLDKATKQGIFLAEEALDSAIDSLTTAQELAAAAATALPAVSSQAEHILQVTSAGNAFEVVSPADARTGLGLGTGATAVLGSGTGQLPVNPSSGAAATLGTAAYKDHGTDVGDVPVNSTAAVLGDAAYKSGGTSSGNVPVLDSTGLPVVVGSQLTNLLRIRPYCKVTHQTAGDNDGNEAGASYALDTWHKRPLTTLAAGTTGITISSSVMAFPAGTYTVSWWSEFLRFSVVSTMLYDTSNTTVLVIGSIGRGSHGNNATSASMQCTSVGSGRFTIGTANVELQFLVEHIENTGSTYSNTDILGQAIGASSVSLAPTNVYTQIDIFKDG